MSKRIPGAGRILAAALFFLMASGATTVAVPMGYSVRYESTTGDGYLYRIDLATGDATDLGLVGLWDIEGMTFVGETLYGIGGQVHELWDITTPPGSKIGDTGPRSGMDAGLAYDPTSGKLYNIQRDGTGSWLYEINIATGATTLIGADTVGIPDSLAIDDSGMAYAFDAIRDDLYTVDLSSGDLTLVGPSGVDLMAGAGLSFDDAGGLWALMDDGGIYTLDTTTGAATFVTTTLSGFQALAIPEPATILMLALGAGLLFRKRPANPRVARQRSIV